MVGCGRAVVPGARGGAAARGGALPHCAGNAGPCVPGAFAVPFKPIPLPVLGAAAPGRGWCPPFVLRLSGLGCLGAPGRCNFRGWLPWLWLVAFRVACAWAAPLASWVVARADWVGVPEARARCHAVVPLLGARARGRVMRCAARCVGWGTMLGA